MRKHEKKIGLRSDHTDIIERLEGRGGLGALLRGTPQVTVWAIVPDAISEVDDSVSAAADS